MLPLLKLRMLAGSTTTALVLCCAPNAQALDITLPQETATFEQSTLPGYQKVLQNCTACHSAQYIQTQPASSKAWWQGEVRKMKQTYGASIPDADMNVMAEYLYTVYGSGHGSDKANAVKTSAQASASPPDDSKASSHASAPSGSKDGK